MRRDINPRLPFGGKTSIQIGYARELFAAMKADGDKPKPDLITFADLEGLQPAPTFEKFLKINNMVTFEEVAR